MKLKKLIVLVAALLMMAMLFASCVPAQSELPAGGGGEIEMPDNEQNGGGSNAGEGETPPIEPPDQEPTIPDVPPDEPTPPPTPPPAENLSPSSVYKLQASADVNIRSGAGKGYAVVGSLKRWKFAPYIEKTGEWYKTLLNGKGAYIHSQYAKLVSIHAVADPIEQIIDTGMDLLSLPYEYGAPRLLTWDFKMNPSFTGKSFDCSSFVQYAFYKGAGVKLLGDSRSMSTQNAVVVSLSALRRGDVIFMTTPSRWNLTGTERIGHVGIYLGGDKLLHTYGAPGVVVTSFTGVWKDRFVSAKRFV